MSCPISKENLTHLKAFISYCAVDPNVLYSPELEFFKSYLLSLGAALPPKMSTDDIPKRESTTTSAPDDDSGAAPEVEEDSDPESDLELDMEGVVDGDAVGDKQLMGDSEKIPTEEEMDQANEKRVQAMSELSEGNNEKAIELFTEAILLNPTSALLFAKRGQCYLKLTKPNACIKDCNSALELNPDSAAAFKFRGRAYRLLGEWEKAVKDLSQSCNIDFDEQTDEWLREVTPNAHKVIQHRLKQERKAQEKELRVKQERVKKAKEAHAAAAASGGDEPPAGRPEPNLGEGAAGMGDFYKLLNDPEVMTAFQDPEVSAAFQDITANPANFMKYQNNPKIMKLLTKLSSKFAGSGMNIPGFPGGMGGFPGGAPGGGFPGGFPGAAPGPQDDGLD